MNPVVAGIAVDQGIEATRSAGRSAKSATAQVNKDTKGALSWIILAGVVIGGYYVFRAVSGLSKVGSGITNAVSEATGIATNVLKGTQEFFTVNPDTGGGMLKDIADPNHKPQGATINLLQAQTQARQLYDIFKGVGQLNNAEKQQVYAIMLNKTPVDLLMIDTAFGTPRRNSITGSGNLWGPKTNLIGWFNAELDPSGMNFLRSITHNIF